MYSNTHIHIHVHVHIRGQFDQYEQERMQKYDVVPLIDQTGKLSEYLCARVRVCV
jgi:hypothetical protein